MRTVKEWKALTIARERELEQILGSVLGYPRYCDDQKNFPGSTPDDGCCVGDNTPESLVEEAAALIRRLRAENTALKGKE